MLTMEKNSTTIQNESTLASISRITRLFNGRRAWALAVCSFMLALGYTAGWWHWPVSRGLRGGNTPSAIPDNHIACKPGPWGDLAYVPIYIEPPEEFLQVED